MPPTPDDKADLVALAKSLAASSTDLYALLAVDPTTPRSDIHRAWRRQGLKYHPDKAGANYDAAKYELFERARNVLTDEDARAAYDAARGAAALRARQSEMMGEERRRFKEELEVGERRAREEREGGAAGKGDGEMEMLREAGRRKVEERERVAREAEEREERKKDERIAELERRLREKEDKARRKAERKAREGGVEQISETTAAKAAEEQRPVMPDTEWREMLGSEEVPFEKRPIYAYTLARLNAAEAQRQEKLRTSGQPTSVFVPQWTKVIDPDVRKFITRVPKFGPTSKGKDVEMELAA